MFFQPIRRGQPSSSRAHPSPRRARKDLPLAVALAIVGLTATALADPPHPGPPPEAFTACEGKAVGDACTVSLHGTDLAGTCSTPPGNQGLACRPNHRPPRPPPSEPEG
jgi:hypothetical protein